MTYNILDVVKDELRGTADKLTKEEQQKRLDVCKSCEFLTKLTQQCSKCGCFVAMKTKYRSSECDAKKWPF